MAICPQQAPRRGGDLGRLGVGRLRSLSTQICVRYMGASGLYEPQISRQEPAGVKDGGMRNTIRGLVIPAVSAGLRRPRRDCNGSHLQHRAPAAHQVPRQRFQARWRLWRAALPTQLPRNENFPESSCISPSQSREPLQRTSAVGGMTLGKSRERY